MLISIFRNTSLDVKTKFMIAIFSVVIVVFSLTIHEVSHGLSALALGDPTAKNRGRLTLNPLKHLNPIGAICMLLVGFGWAEPVPINPNYFKHRKAGMAITALAGPVSNLLLSLIASFACVITVSTAGFQIGQAVYFEKSAPYLIYEFFYLLHTMNLYLAIFNLIPVPPLDGSRILFTFLPAKYYFKMMKYEQYVAIGLIVLLYIGVLDGPLSFITGGISNAMFNLADLII